MLEGSGDGEDEFVFERATDDLPPRGRPSFERVMGTEALGKPVRLSH